MALPLLGWALVPARAKAGLALLLTVFFALLKPSGLVPAQVSWTAAGILLVREVLGGLALGLAVHLVYLAVQQAGLIMGMEMGLAEAGIFDPVTGEETESMGMFMEMTFALFFLAAGGHHLLLAIINQSYEAFPVGASPGAGAMAEALVRSGSAMLTFALQLAAPLMAAFLVVSVVLAIVARVMPDMDILMTSFPLRIGVGLLLAAAMIPSLGSFTGELARWLDQNLLS
jgi:flagellar biosynthetic protein FliR